MKDLFLTPGPSKLHPLAVEYIRKGVEEDVYSMSHRSDRFRGLSWECMEALRELMGIPESSKIFYVSSATEAMERTIENCSATGTFHFINGAFSRRFYDTSRALFKDARCTEVDAGSGYDCLDQEIPDDTELICLTHNETSTGVAIPEAQIAALKSKWPDRIIAVDIVSSAPYCALDFSKVDVAFFSVQKCFGLPAGLGVMIVSEEAMSKAYALKDKGRSIGSYHSFLSLGASADKYETPETPNVLAIYLLSKVARHMCNEGITKLRREIRDRADAIRAFVNKSSALELFVKDLDFRSDTVVNINVSTSSVELKALLAENGIHVGLGYGEWRERQIRVANFPAHDAQDMERLFSVLRTL